MSHDPETEDAPIKGTGPIYEGPLSAARIDAQIRHVFREWVGGYMVGIDPAIGKDKLVLKLVAMPPATEPTDAELEDLGDMLQLAWERGLHWRWCALAAFRWFRDTGRLSPVVPVPVPLPTQTPGALWDTDEAADVFYAAWAGNNPYVEKPQSPEAIHIIRGNFRRGLRAAGAVEPAKATRPEVTATFADRCGDHARYYFRNGEYVTNGNMQVILAWARDQWFPAAPATGTEGGK